MTSVSAVSYTHLDVYKRQEFIEETGVNVAYMAFGFVHWKESAASNYVFRAPILLVPIRLEQASAVEPVSYTHLRSPEKACYINGLHRSNGAYYTTITPFSKEL